MKLLSVIIPVYNEIATIAEVLRRVRAAAPGIAKEIIVVDDGSTDGTREFLVSAGQSLRVLLQESQVGKGAAVRRGLAASIGDYIVTQDADLEYSPEEYERLLQPLLAGEADAVYGSRFLGGRPVGEGLLHYLVNRSLTILSNIANGTSLTDMETCHKMFSRIVADDICPRLVADRFDIEPEITARIAKAGYRIAEVDIGYHKRTYSEGKKIGWKDGIQALVAIVRFGLMGRR